MFDNIDYYHIEEIHANCIPYCNIVRFFDYKIINYASVVPNCGGITYELSIGNWTLRSGTELRSSPTGEISMRKACFSKYSNT